MTSVGRKCPPRRKKGRSGAAIQELQAFLVPHIVRQVPTSLAPPARSVAAHLLMLLSVV